MDPLERETTIVYNMAESHVMIFSAIRRDQTRLEKAGFKPTYGTAEHGFGYRVPLSLFRWGIRGKKRPGNPAILKAYRARQGVDMGGSK